MTFSLATPIIDLTVFCHVKVPDIFVGLKAISSAEDLLAHHPRQPRLPSDL